MRTRNRIGGIAFVVLRGIHQKARAFIDETRVQRLAPDDLLGQQLAPIVVPLVIHVLVLDPSAPTSELKMPARPAMDSGPIDKW